MTKTKPERVPHGTLPLVPDPGRDFCFLEPPTSEGREGNTKSHESLWHYTTAPIMSCDTAAGKRSASGIPRGRVYAPRDRHSGRHLPTPNKARVLCELAKLISARAHMERVQEKGREGKKLYFSSLNPMNQRGRYGWSKEVERMARGENGSPSPKAEWRKVDLKVVPPTNNGQTFGKRSERRANQKADSVLVHEHTHTHTHMMILNLPQCYTSAPGVIMSGCGIGRQPRAIAAFWDRHLGPRS